MPTEAIVTLEDLECITLHNTETKVEPYIWPALIKIDTSTINSTDGRFVDVIALSPSLASVLIKSSMRQGDLARIPASVASLRAQFGDGVSGKRLILIVTLLEMDETPKGAMRKGFQAYVDELRAAFKDEFPKLFQAESVNDEVEVEKITARIKDRVEKKTRSAIKGALSLTDKAGSVFGFLDNDDLVSSSVIKFRETFFQTTPNATPITLVFQAKDRFSFLPPSFVRYHIRARLEARPVVIDRCQSQANAVKKAQAAVDSIEERIETLETIGDRVFPPKPPDEAAIERIREEELAPALAELKKVNTALQLCRSQIITSRPIH